MAELSYSLPGYRNRIRMSRNRRLLVEGRSDKMAFQCLLDEARRVGYFTPANVVIDTAEILRDTEPGLAGNRQRVEAVAESIREERFKEKVVCFVDREFREFDDAQWVDRIGDHHVVDRLVWSRGHSIENYFLDFETIRAVLRAVAMTDGFDAAIVIMESTFASVLRVACVAGLAGSETGYVALIAESIDPATINLDDHALTAHLDAPRLTERMMAKKGCTEELVQAVMTAYQGWHPRVASAPDDLIRWATHGHFTLPMLWAAYARCVFRATGSTAEADRSQSAPKDTRFNNCASVWAQRAFANGAEFPRLVLEMLGFERKNGASAPQSQ